MREIKNAIDKIIVDFNKHNKEIESLSDECKASIINLSKLTGVLIRQNTNLIKINKAYLKIIEKQNGANNEKEKTPTIN